MSISSLNENMNIVQSLIIPGIDTDMDIIQKLDDEPNDCLLYTSDAADE